MTHKFDCAVLNTKNALLKRFAEILKEMYSLNYDALFDAATFFHEDATWAFENTEKYEDPDLLREIMQDIASENPHIKIVGI